MLKTYENKQIWDSQWIFEKISISLLPLFAVTYYLLTQVHMVKPPVRDTEIKKDSYSLNQQSVILAV